MGLIDNKRKCQNKIIVPYYDCDFKNKMKLSCVLRYAQQISMEHCDLLNIGENLLNKLNVAFLLGKMVIKIKEYPKANQKVIITTTPDDKPIKAQYKRATVFTAEDGEVLIEIDSRWILVNCETKKIIRQKPEELLFPKQYKETFVFDNKIHKKDYTDLLCKSEHVVRYSDIDTNMHLNNTVYADIICNSLPRKIIRNNSIKKLIINYKNQAVYNDIIKINVKAKDNNKNEIYFDGNIEDKQCFEACIEVE